MNGSKTLIITNPAAGSAEGGDSLPTLIEKLLPGANLKVAENPDELRELAHTAPSRGYKTVVAAGGDGTLNAVLNGLGDRMGDVRLGLIPLGTGNDFARSVSVPTSLEHSLALLREGRSNAVDVIRVTGKHGTRYSINICAGGFSTKVSEAASEAKEAWGPFCYARSLIGALPELSDYHTTIRLDDSESLLTPAYNVIVANARFVAGGVPIAPTARLDDGLADVVILPVTSVRDLAALGPLTLLGRHLQDERIIYRKARRIELQSTPEMRFNTDGELLPAGDLVFEVLPAAVHFIVGPQPVQEEPPLSLEPRLAPRQQAIPVL